MKKIIIFFLLLTMSVSSFSQQTNSTSVLTKQDYLQKSKSQKTTAFILLGVGATAIAIAAPGNVSFDILPVLVIGGGLATIISIPLFIASARNKRKAKNASVFLKMETIPKIQEDSFVSNSYPAVSLNINL